MKVWLALLLPAILGTLAVATAPITLSGVFGAAAGIWLVYLFFGAAANYARGGR